MDNKLTTTSSRPVPFNGTEEERLANRKTHFFFPWHEDTRCVDCDSRPSHVAADYPCGDEPPREVVTITR